MYEYNDYQIFWNNLFYKHNFLIIIIIIMLLYFINKLFEKTFIFLLILTKLTKY